MKRYVCGGLCVIEVDPATWTFTDSDGDERPDDHNFATAAEAWLDGHRMALWHLDRAAKYVAEIEAKMVAAGVPVPGRGSDCA